MTGKSDPARLELTVKISCLNIGKDVVCHLGLDCNKGALRPDQYIHLVVNLLCYLLVQLV